MEAFSHRKSVVLGYSPQRSSINHAIPSPQSPEIDFQDVFGGPPRRASIQEMRHSFGEGTDSFALTSNEKTISHRHRWSGLSEKPVFGEESVNRRRHPSGDFFDDIFRGGESLRSSPRKNDRDLFSSTPGSRVLSPARPLPPRVSEPFASSSLPEQFSLPAKLIKGTDLPTFGTSARNHHSKNKDGISNGISLYSPTPLSRFPNQVQEESRKDSNAELTSLEKPDEMNEGSNLKKDSNYSETTTINHQFHFSIYKWESKGVPLTLPSKRGDNSKSKEKFKIERSLSGSRRIACESMEKESPTRTSRYIDSCKGVSLNAKSCEIELDKLVQKQAIEETILCKSESGIPSTLQETVKDGPGNVIFQDSEEGKEQISVATQEACKTEIKTLRSLLLAPDDVTVEKELEESQVKSIKKYAAAFAVGEKVTKENGIRDKLNSKVIDKAELQNLPTNSRDSPAKNRARGKVKEFVKIFDQETSDQPISNETSQSRRFRWTERGKFNTQVDQSAAKTKVNENVPLPNVSKTNTSDAPVMIDESIQQYEKHRSQERTDDYKPTNTASRLKDKSAATAGLVSDSSEAIDGQRGDSFHDNILIKELRQDEEIQAIDAKIKNWSNGKEGNIRSLLSTLQYVLWADSGWKPVPLVDIIEGNAVKRSYQKALLSLHPDKLQQKDATSHQRYIAEKVFDILQEAWTHFNSLGSV